MKENKKEVSRIHGVEVFDRDVFTDHRGTLSRIFSAEALLELGWRGAIHQVNTSNTRTKGTIRGLHLQNSESPEFKLVTCTQGVVFDVAVDLRTGSSTFLSWTGQILSAENTKAIIIPPGCAHGFQSLSDEVTLIYCHSAPFVEEAQWGANPFDQALSITWPVEVSAISKRDKNHKPLGKLFQGFQA